MSHHSDFAEVALAPPSTSITGNGTTPGPTAKGTVTPDDGRVDWIHVWIIQPQGASFAAAVGFWPPAESTGPTADRAWTVQTTLQPGSDAFIEGPVFAMALASMSSTRADDTTATIQQWSETVSCVTLP